MCGNYSREETIQGRKLYEEIQYFFQFGTFLKFGSLIFALTLLIWLQLKTYRFSQGRNNLSQGGETFVDVGPFF
jgi:hypothetical protein